MDFKTVKDFLEYIKVEVEADRLTLPTLPEIALQVKSAVEEDEASVESVSRIISTDIALSARIIQVANSPLYRGVVETTSINQAVSRLGLKSIKSLVTSIVMRQIFAPTSDALEEHFRDSWQESKTVASVASAMTSFAKHLQKEEAFLAGLVHQIGKLPILAVAENMPSFRDSPTRLANLLKKAHPPIGKMILESWGFPDEICMIPMNFSNLERTHEGKADYSDIVQVAYVQSVLLSQGNASNIDTNAIPSFQLLGLVSDDEEISFDVDMSFDQDASLFD